MKRSNYKKLFMKLSNNLDIFIQEVKSKKSNLMATDKWTVKDVLCHIVFWHESYAANFDALAMSQEPSLLDGPGYKLNKEGVSFLKKYTVKELIKRLKKAQNTLYRSIVVKGVSQMTYKKEGHVYTTSDFLGVIARHILTHTKHVKRAK
jgi:hypothetical protein